jgi:hypothetical protein
LPECSAIARLGQNAFLEGAIETLRRSATGLMPYTVKNDTLFLEMTLGPISDRVQYGPMVADSQHHASHESPVAPFQQTDTQMRFQTAIRSLTDLLFTPRQRDGLDPNGDAASPHRRLPGIGDPADRTSYILPSHVKIGTIAGSMKSGTTWLVNLLDDHPNIFSRMEMHLLGEMPVDDPVIHRLLCRYPGRWPTLQQLLRHSDEFRIWLLKGNDYWNVECRHNPAAITEALQMDMLRFVFEWRATRAIETSSPEKKVEWIFDKSPIHYTDYYDLFNKCFRGCHRAIVHLVRDPRDVVLSLWYFLRQLQFVDLQEKPDSLDPEDRQACQEILSCEEGRLSRQRHFFTVPDFLPLALRHWNEVNRNLHEAAKAGHCPYLLVRYEDLKRDKVGSLGRIFEFLDLPAEPQSLESFGRLQTADGTPRPTTFRKGMVGEWHKWFTAEDCDIVRAECGELMELFGYQD